MRANFLNFYTVPLPPSKVSCRSAWGQALGGCIIWPDCCSQRCPADLVRQPDALITNKKLKVDNYEFVVLEEESLKNNLGAKSAPSILLFSNGNTREKALCVKLSKITLLENFSSNRMIILACRKITSN